MSFDWSEYLTVAELLVNQSNLFGSEEAVMRIAISRAYYGAFCEARNFLHARGLVAPVKTGEDHERIRRHFANSRNQAWKDIGNWLLRLRDNRNTADYDNNSIPNPHALAMTSLVQARDVINRLKTL